MVDTNIFFDKNQSSELLKALLKKKTATDVINTWNKKYLKPVYELFAKGNLDSLGHIQNYAALGKVCAIVFHHLTQLEDNRAYIAAEEIRDTTIAETYSYTNLSKKQATNLVDSSWVNLKENFLENEKLTLEEAADLGIKELINNNREDIKLILEADGRNYINPINLEANKGETLNNEQPKKEVELHKEEQDQDIQVQKSEVELPKEEQEPDYLNEVEGLVEATAQEIGKTTPLIQWGSCSKFLDKLPTQHEELFTSGAWCFARGCVNVIPARGGVGKSFYTLEIAMSLATGAPFLTPWIPTKAVGVAYVTAEDPEEELWKRIYYIYQAFPELQENRELLERNFTAVSLQGKYDNTHLLQLDPQKNIQTTEFYSVLDKSLEVLKTSNPELKVVCFDTLSRFFGLNENDNQSGADFTAIIEKLALKHSITPVVLAHISKEGAKGDINDISIRGAGSFADNARYVLPMRLMDKDNPHKIENFKDYVEVCPNKNNYTAGESKSQWYKRNENGVLIPTQIQATANETNEQAIKKFVEDYYTIFETEEQKAEIYEDNPLILSHLTDGSHPERQNRGAKAFTKTLKANGITVKSFEYCLEQLINHMELKIVEVRNTQNRPTKILIPWEKDIIEYFENKNYRLTAKGKPKKD